MIVQKVDQEIELLKNLKKLTLKGKRSELSRMLSLPQLEELILNFQENQLFSIVLDELPSLRYFSVTCQKDPNYLSAKPRMSIVGQLPNLVSLQLSKCNLENLNNLLQKLPPLKIFKCYEILQREQLSLLKQQNLQSLSCLTMDCSALACSHTLQSLQVILQRSKVNLINYQYLEEITLLSHRSQIVLQNLPKFKRATFGRNIFKFPGGITENKFILRKSMDLQLFLPYYELQPLIPFRLNPMTLFFWEFNLTHKQIIELFPNNENVTLTIPQQQPLLQNITSLLPNLTFLELTLDAITPGKISFQIEHPKIIELLILSYKLEKRQPINVALGKRCANLQKAKLNIQRGIINLFVETDLQCMDVQADTLMLHSQNKISKLILTVEQLNPKNHILSPNKIQRIILSCRYLKYQFADAVDFSELYSLQANIKNQLQLDFWLQQSPSLKHLCILYAANQQARLKIDSQSLKSVDISKVKLLQLSKEIPLIIKA